MHLNDARVDVNLIYRGFEQVPVSIILLGSLGFGVTIGYLLSLINILKIKSDLRKTDNKNRILTDELNNLRILQSMRKSFLKTKIKEFFRLVSF